MNGQDFDSRLAAMKSFAQKHRILLIVGGVLLVLFAMNDEGGGAFGSPPQPQGEMPSGMPTGNPVVSTGGGVDMDQWRDEQRRGDIEQRDRIDAIREVERCYDSTTGETVEVSIHVGC